MLFAAGIGTDLMFFSVAEPVTQYLAPPVGQGETVEAAREATVWTLFHYGISGWGMYALMGMALAYFSYRMNLPLAIRSSLYPIFGKRIHGVLGHSVDIGRRDRHHLRCRHLARHRRGAAQLRAQDAVRDPRGGAPRRSAWSCSRS